MSLIFVTKHITDELLRAEKAFRTESDKDEPALFVRTIFTMLFMKEKNPLKIKWLKKLVSANTLFVWGSTD